MYTEIQCPKYITFSILRAIINYSGITIIGMTNYNDLQFTGMISIFRMISIVKTINVLSLF